MGRLEFRNFVPLAEGYWAVHSGIERLKLTRCSCNSVNILDICGHYNLLKSLHIEGDKSAGTGCPCLPRDNPIDGSWEVTERRVSGALLPREDTLEYVYLRLFYPGYVGLLVRREFQVICWPQMSRLKSISTEPVRYAEP